LINACQGAVAILVNSFLWPGALGAEVFSWRGVFRDFLTWTKGFFLSSVEKFVEKPPSSYDNVKTMNGF
jgi:hypothetical protein